VAPGGSLQGSFSISRRNSIAKPRLDLQASVRAGVVEEKRWVVGRGRASTAAADEEDREEGERGGMIETMASEKAHDPVLRLAQRR